MLAIVAAARVQAMFGRHPLILLGGAGGESRVFEHDGKRFVHSFFLLFLFPEYRIAATAGETW